MKPLATSGRLQLYLSGTLLLAALCPRSTHAQATTVLATVRDSTGAPVFPSRIDVIGTVITERGDSLGRVVLRGVPRGLHQLAVRGIGFFERIVSFEARGDTLRLPAIVLRRNPIFDSLNIVAPRKGSCVSPSYVGAYAHEAVVPGRPHL